MLKLADIAEMLTTADKPSFFPLVLQGLSVFREIADEGEGGQIARSMISGREDLEVLGILGSLAISGLVTDGTWEQVDWHKIVPGEKPLSVFVRSQLSQLKGGVPPDEGERGIAIADALTDFNLLKTAGLLVKTKVLEPNLEKVAEPTPSVLSRFKFGGI